MPKISVIVPVYNTEKYLKKCLDSILKQTYQDFEIIIINDGSTDNSETIINEYQKKYSEKVKYFKKENGGLSETRNYGVKVATGDYLSFIDSDDYIDEELFENLLPYIEKNIDLIKFKLIKIDENDSEIERIDGPIFDEVLGQDGFNKLFGKDVLIETSCLYLYNTKFFKENNFEFAKNLYHEDFGLTPIILLSAKSMVSVDCYGYYYVQANNSITRNTDYKKTVKRANDLLVHYDNMLEQIKSMDINIDALENIKLYYTNSILLATKTLNGNEKKEYILNIKKRDMIKNIKAKNTKQLLKKIMLKISINLYLNFK